MATEPNLYTTALAPPWWDPTGPTEPVDILQVSGSRAYVRYPDGAHEWWNLADLEGLR